MTNYDSVFVSLLTFWIITIVLMFGFAENIVDGNIDLKTKIDPYNKGLNWSDRFQFLWSIISFQIVGVPMIIGFFVNTTTFFLFTYIIIRISRG